MYACVCIEGIIYLLLGDVQLDETTGLMHVTGLRRKYLHICMNSCFYPRRGSLGVFDILLSRTEDM